MSSGEANSRISISRTGPGSVLACGIVGEAGELLDAIKKHVIYQTTLDVKNVIEELGDIEFYMEGLRQGLSVSRGSVLEANVNKLNKRYPDGAFTKKHAETRLDKQVGEK